MNNKVLFFFAFVFTIVLYGSNTKIKKENIIKLENGWKFHPGDNLEYANSDFDDSNWKEISVGMFWEKQGYKKLDGYAWYRIKVIIPSALVENAVLKDSLIFNFGRIDDFDQFFFNGKLVGENAHNLKEGTAVTDTFKNFDHSLWNVNRRYSLSTKSNLIKWDKENVIAIRVFDICYGGGLSAGKPNIVTQKLRDYLSVNLNDYFKNNSDLLNKKITFTNSSSFYTIKGKLKIDVQNNINDSEPFKKTISFNLIPKAKENLIFSFPKPEESTTIRCEFTFLDSSKKIIKEGVPYILTPKEKDTPQINGALVYGERPKKPFLYKIAATGKRPITFSAKNLPEGLSLNKHTGIITGKVSAVGKYKVLLNVKNKYGSDSKTLEIVIGDKLALTPPMGWNSWNCWGLSVSQNKVFNAAKSFIDKGLANHGWTYINIDDGWEIFGKSNLPKRSVNGEILTNEKFPDMKKLGDDIHNLGLKFGIYSSPGPLTCGGYTASYNHEYQDAKTFGKWGIDYLKYDLCSYNKFMKYIRNPDELKPPYILMNKALKNSGRDIVYSICEYGLGKVWEWGANVGGNLWRTTGDIRDNWGSLYKIGFNQIENAKYAGPGHWNDPDMLVLGWVGWGPNLHKTALTPDEQYTHVSLWALLSAPLLLGNDLTKLDDFTLNLITNDEVIAIDQDKLGKQATPIIKRNGIEVWKKYLSDGNIAIGIFNVSEENKIYTLNLQDLGINKKTIIRDLWRQKDLGKFTKFNTKIPSHGVKLLKVMLVK